MSNHHQPQCQSYWPLKTDYFPRCSWTYCSPNASVFQHFVTYYSSYRASAQSWQAVPPASYSAGFSASHRGCMASAQPCPTPLHCLWLRFAWRRNERTELCAVIEASGDYPNLRCFRSELGGCRCQRPWNQIKWRRG